MFTPWKPELYLDIINAKNISYIQRFKFPITLSSNALGDKRTISGNIISGNMVKLNMDYYYDIYEKEIPISIIWVYNYPIDKEKLYKINPITKLRYFELSPKAL